MSGLSICTLIASLRAWSCRVLLSRKRRTSSSTVYTDVFSRLARQRVCSPRLGFSCLCCNADISRCLTLRLADLSVEVILGGRLASYAGLPHPKTAIVYRPIVSWRHRTTLTRLRLRRARMNLRVVLVARPEVSESSCDVPPVRTRASTTAA
jgi:hypothetical protein